MKKLLLFALCLLLTVPLLAGCGKADASKTSDASAASDSTAEDPDIVYKKPADVAGIDQTAEDPSNEVLTFSYDKEGRVTGCSYALDGHQIAIIYTYNDEENTVQLTAFSDDIVAALEEYDLPGAFDAARGFTEYKGYYFRGYDFQK